MSIMFGLSMVAIKVISFVLLLASIMTLEGNQHGS